MAKIIAIPSEYYPPRRCWIRYCVIPHRWRRRQEWRAEDTAELQRQYDAARRTDQRVLVVGYNIQLGKGDTELFEREVRPFYENCELVGLLRPAGRRFFSCWFKATRLNDGVHRAAFVGEAGLHGDGLVNGHPSLKYTPGEDPRFQHFAFDFPTWARLRVVASLPAVFGVSNVAIVTIVLYASVAAAYNRNLAAIGEWIAGAAEAETLRVELAAFLVQNLGQLPAPPELRWLLLSLLGLIGAELVYRTWCPNVVKDYSLPQYEGSHDERFTYMAASHCNLIARWICLMLFAACGGYTVIYLLFRVARALAFYI